MLTKHSNSLKQQSFQLSQMSFFDTSYSTEKFWKQMDLKDDDFSSYPLIIENNFKIPCKGVFQTWETCTLTIRGNFLLLKKKKYKNYVDYIDFTEFMYRVEVNKPDSKFYSKKYPYSFNIYANGKSVDMYCKEPVQLEKWLCELRKVCIMAGFHNNYRVMDVIGTGGYGKVHILEHTKTKMRFAGKFIKITNSVGRERHRVMITNEIKILRKLDHPDIVKLHEVYELTGQICLVMDYVEGDKLFNHITRHKILSERSTAYIMKQIFLMLHYLEEQDIIHRDIKPENILFSKDEKNNLNLKLIDFGLGTHHKKRDMIKKCGTAGYVAPEILNGEAYDFKADIYSAGIIMYICLLGRPAFYGRDYDEVLARNKRGAIRFKGITWSKVSLEAQDLLEKLLEPSASSRISITDALNHTWLYKTIPPEDRKDLSECLFKVVKLTIPEEQMISKIPVSCGHIPIVSKIFTNSGISNADAMTASQRPVSNSFFITSNLAAGIDDKKELHSFYRLTSSNEDSLRSQKSMSNAGSRLSSSPIQSRRNSHVSRGLTLTIPQKYANPNVLQVPSVQLNSPRRTLSHIHSQRSLLQTLDVWKHGIGYTINVAAAVDSSIELEDLELGCDEDEGTGSLCSLNYEDLTDNAARFVLKAKNLQSRQNRSFIARTTTIKIHHDPPVQRFETEI